MRMLALRDNKGLAAKETKKEAAGMPAASLDSLNQFLLTE